MSAADKLLVTVLWRPHDLLASSQLDLWLCHADSLLRCMYTSQVPEDISKDPEQLLLVRH